MTLRHHALSTGKRTAAVIGLAVVVMFAVPRTARAQGATFYEHLDYSGASFGSTTDIAFVGWDWNDAITSVTVPPGGSVTIYEHDNFGGTSLNLTSDVADLRWFAGPGADGTWNDAVSSVRVAVASLPPAQNGRGQPVDYANGDGRVIVTPLETDSNANTLEMHVHYIAPSGRFQKASCLRLWADHPEWAPQEIGCEFGTYAGVWEDDYDYYAPMFTGTIASAWMDYQQRLPVRPPPPDDDPFRRTWNGIPCFDLQAVDRGFRDRYLTRTGEAFRNAVIAGGPCILSGIGWLNCVNATYLSTLLTGLAWDYLEYKNACDW